MRPPVTVRDVPSPPREARERILNDAEATTALLTKHVNPQAVLWHGGFARGEGGAYLWKDRLWPFGDLDFEVVVTSPPLPSQLEAIESEARESLGYQFVWNLPEPTWRDETTCVNMLDLKFIPPGDWHRRPADLALYDLAISGKFLHGKEELPKPEAIAPRIPRWSGFRIAGNRLFNALQVFSLELLREPITFQRGGSLELARTRLWLDLGNALLLSMGRVEPTLRKRGEALEELMPTRTWNSRGEEVLWRAIGERFPAMLARKLRPVLDEVRAGALVEDAIVGASAMAMLADVRAVDSETGLPSPEDYLRAIRREVAPRFYRDYIRSLPHPIAKLAWPLGMLAHSVETARWKGWPWTLMRPRRWLYSPEMAYLACVPLVWLALDPEGEEDEEVLRQIGKEIAPYLETTLPRDWEGMRKQVVEVFGGYRRGRARPRVL